MQQAFLDQDGFRCGYCTPGQVCSAVGMLEEVKAGHPSHITADLTADVELSDAEIRERMSGNRNDHGLTPATGAHSTADAAENPDAEKYASHSFGAYGISGALHEESVRDHRFGHIVTQDLAGYHISTHADIRDIDAIWLDEVDEHVNPMGSRGAGEIGIVGAAAAVANAVYHATGVRVRDLPITVDDLLI